MLVLFSYMRMCFNKGVYGVTGIGTESGIKETVPCFVDLSLRKLICCCFDKFLYINEEIMDIIISTSLLQVLNIWRFGLV